MKKEFYVICDNIRSLENIGSIFRTSDALGVSKIYLCGISGKPPHHKISKTALGAEETIPWEYCKSTSRLIDRLKRPSFVPPLRDFEGRSKIQIVALEQDKKAISYEKFVPKFPLALIIGNEVEGVSKKILKKADKIIFLPMSGQKESLNVSVAFGVAGYHIIKNK
ncbi:MAG: TrmH family RNA methyltransferase [Candidatus Staskawiczbacteria bacterium]|nr:TrmH family RNA methyltransferase [Candidatus Staskawiczbacteria bacterium]